MKKLFFILSLILTVALTSCGGEKKDAKTEGQENHDHADVYACPMHPDVTSDKAGTCSECGMALEKQEHAH